MNGRILLVDDEEAIRELLTVSLAKMEYAVSAVDTASEAIRMVHEQDFDLALVDLSLPDSAGLDLLDLLKMSKPKLPVIIITGQAIDSQLKNDALGKGASDCISKMHSLDLLLQKVDRLFRSR